MKEELDKKLCDDFPIIYKDRHANMQTTCMCWGFSCGPGWFDLIYTLSSIINNVVENSKSNAIYKYKKDHSIEYDKDLSEDVLKSLKLDEKMAVASQVKEKYGGLRFYHGSCGLTDEENATIDGAVSMAESMSHLICEECGNPGKTNSFGWLQTLCGSCRIRDSMPQI